MSTTSDSGVAAPREWQAWTFALGDLETIDSSRIEAEAAAAAGCLDAVIDEVTDALYNCNPGITYCDEFAEVGRKSQVSGHPTFDWCAPGN